jgi:hypothetical protein
MASPMNFMIFRLSGVGVHVIAWIMSGIGCSEYRLCYTENMSGLYSDTHPKMEALQIHLWRQASPTRKMHMLAQLNASARVLALAGLRSQYPQDSEAELRRRLADLLLGKELAHKVYGEIRVGK